LPRLGDTGVKRRKREFLLMSAVAVLLFFNVLLLAGACVLPRQSQRLQVVSGLMALANALALGFGAGAARVAAVCSSGRGDELSRRAAVDVLQGLRAYRHAVMNHMQVISGWLQLGRADRAREYIERVRIAADSHQQLSAIDDPLVASRLLKWSVEAENTGVLLRFDVERKAGAFLRRPEASLELLDEMIGAAVEAAGQSPAEARELRLTVSVGDGSYSFNLEVPADVPREALEAAERTHAGRHGRFLSASRAGGERSWHLRLPAGGVGSDRVRR